MEVWRLREALEERQGPILDDPIHFSWFWVTLWPPKRVPFSTFFRILRVIFDVCFLDQFFGGLWEPFWWIWDRFLIENFIFFWWCAVLRGNWKIIVFVAIYGTERILAISQKHRILRKSVFLSNAISKWVAGSLFWGFGVDFRAILGVMATQNWKNAKSKTHRKNMSKKVTQAIPRDPSKSGNGPGGSLKGNYQTGRLADWQIGRQANWGKHYGHSTGAQGHGGG